MPGLAANPRFEAQNPSAFPARPNLCMFAPAATHKYMDHEPTVPSTLVPVDFEQKQRPAPYGHPILKIVLAGLVFVLVVFLFKR